MRVCFFRSEKPREGILADAFIQGVLEHGDEGVIRRLTPKTEVASDCEVAVMFGVKSRELWQAHWNAGVHVVMIDKGYARHRSTGPVKVWEYWRISVDAHHPTDKLMNVARPSDRFERLGLYIRPWRESGEHVILAGSSAKYHDFYGLPDPTKFARSVAKRINKISAREIVYRPKPSWREAVPVNGTRFSDGSESISDVLAGAHALVTHGSNACFESVLAGVPCVVLGNAVAAPISSTRLEDIENPRLASEEERLQWLSNLAYQQFTMAEMACGEAWDAVRPQIFG